MVLIFGEISPKSIAKESPEAFALFSAPILRVFLVLLTPFNFLFGQWKKLLSHLFHAQEDRSITEEELLTIVDEVELAGGIDEQEGTLIRSAIEFSELEAGDVLTDVYKRQIHSRRDRQPNQDAQQNHFHKSCLLYTSRCV